MKNRFETLKFLLTDGNLTIQRNDHPLILLIISFKMSYTFLNV